MSIAQSGVAHCWAQQRSSFSSAKCNPDQRDRRAGLSEFSAPSQLPRAQTREETIGHIRFPLTLARKNNRFPQRALSRTTGTLREPFHHEPLESSIQRRLVPEPPPYSRVSPNSAVELEADHS